MGNDDGKRRGIADELRGLHAFLYPKNGGRLRVIVTLIMVLMWAFSFGYEIVVMGEVTRATYLLTLAVIAIVAKIHEINVQEILRGRDGK